VLDTRFSEPNWYKGECKSALVRVLFLCGLPDICISFQVKKDLGIGGNVVSSKTFKNVNGYHKTLTSWISARVSCLEANLCYCDIGSAIPKLWHSTLKSFCLSN
jgi:hypothetical protein